MNIDKLPKLTASAGEYHAPQIKVVEVTLHQVVCQSQQQLTWQSDGAWS